MIKQITQAYIHEKCIAELREDSIGKMEKLMLKKIVFPESFSKSDSFELDSLIRSRTKNIPLITEKISVEIQFSIKSNSLTPAEQYTVDYGTDLSNMSDEDKEEDKKIISKSEIWKSIEEGIL